MTDPSLPTDPSPIPFDPARPLPLVYLAGPYTKPDPCENTHNVIHAANYLADTGLVVPIVPHLSHLWHTVTPKPYKFWTEYDKHLLRACDAFYRIPGESPGADDEFDMARQLRIPYFYEGPDLLTWARSWLAEQDRMAGRSILRDA